MIEWDMKATLTRGGGLRLSLKIIIIMTFLLHSVNAWAADPSAGSAAGAAKAMATTDKYAQKWIPFPGLALKSLTTQEPEAFAAKKGRVLIVVFLASWCIPCQQLVADFKNIATKYESAYTDLIYVFAHDTPPDVRAFTSYHKLNKDAYLGTAKVLEDFHQPDLPSIYVADRYGWLVYRKLNLKENDLKELEHLLHLHTSF